MYVRMYVVIYAVLCKSQMFGFWSVMRCRQGSDYQGPKLICSVAVSQTYTHSEKDPSSGTKRTSSPATDATSRCQSGIAWRVKTERPENWGNNLLPRHLKKFHANAPTVVEKLLQAKSGWFWVFQFVGHCMGNKYNLFMAWFLVTKHLHNAVYLHTYEHISVPSVARYLRQWLEQTMTLTDECNNNNSNNDDDNNK